MGNEPWEIELWREAISWRRALLQAISEAQVAQLHKKPVTIFAPVWRVCGAIRRDALQMAGASRGASLGAPRAAATCRAGSHP